MSEDLASLGFIVDSSGIRGATRELRRMDTAQGRAERSNRQLSAASTALKAALTGVIASIGVREIIQYADIWQNVANQLRQVTNGTAELEAIQVRLGNVANDTRASFESTANLYARLARSSTELGLSQSDLIGLTTTINQSFAVSGATAAETAASITQLSQGLAAGALRGEEFNSVSEQAPALMRAISDSLGMTIGELRAFAAEGGITAEIVVKALQQASEEIDRNFSKTIATFSQNIAVANNKVLEWVGTNSAISESVGTAGAAIVLLSENIDNLVTVAGPAAIVFGGKFASAMIAASVGAVKNQAANLQLAGATLRLSAAEQSATAVALRRAAAESASAASRARIAVQDSVIARQVAAQNVERFSATLAAISSEKALEAQRIRSQITALGVQKSVARMAELRVSESALTNQLSVATAKLTSARAAEASTTRLAALASAQNATATTAATAATTAYAAAAHAASRANTVLAVTARAASAAMAFVGGPIGVALIAAASLYYFRDALFATEVAASDAEKEVRKMGETIDDMTMAVAESNMQNLNQQMAENAIATATASAQLENYTKKKKQQDIANQGRPGAATMQLAGVEEELAVLKATGKAMTEVYDQLEARRDKLADAASASNKREAQSANDAVQKIISGLQDEYLQLTLNEEQLLRHKLASNVASQAQFDLAVNTLKASRAIEEQRKQEDALSEMRRELDPAFAEFDRYADQIDAIDAFNTSAAEKERFREAAFSEHTTRMIEIAGEGASKRFEVEETYWQQWMESAERNLTNFDDLSKTVIDNFTRSFGDAFEAVILDSENTEEALKGLARTMIRSVVNAIGQMIAQWAALQALKMAGIGTETAAVVASEATKSAASVAGTTVAATASIAATTATTATQVAAAGTTAAAWLPAALVASIGSFGAAAVVGGAALVAAYALIGGSFEGGGYTGSGPRSGGVDGKGGFPAILHPNETVIDHTKSKGTSGGGGGGVTVQINDMTSGNHEYQTQETQGPGGDKQIRVLIRNVMREDIQSGEYDRQMESSFGMRRKARRV